jgi:hypothetical protein
VIVIIPFDGACEARTHRPGIFKNSDARLVRNIPHTQNIEHIAGPVSMPNELLQWAEHCRVMSGQTYDLQAAREFRILSENLARKGAELEALIERARLKDPRLK